MPTRKGLTMKIVTRGHVLTESGPIVAFKSYNIECDFKNLSVREIDS